MLRYLPPSGCDSLDARQQHAGCSQDLTCIDVVSHHRSTHALQPGNMTVPCVKHSSKLCILYLSTDQHTPKLYSHTFLCVSGSTTDWVSVPKNTALIMTREKAGYLNIMRSPLSSSSTPDPTQHEVSTCLEAIIRGLGAQSRAWRVKRARAGTEPGVEDDMLYGHRDGIIALSRTLSLGKPLLVRFGINAHFCVYGRGIGGGWRGGGDMLTCSLLMCHLHSQPSMCC